MGRDKVKDNKNCSLEHNLEYVATLYKDKLTILSFLQKKYMEGTLRYYTHIDVYRLVEKEFGYQVPD